MNIGIGYHYEHEDRAYASLREIRSQFRKFITFYSKFSETKFEYVPRSNMIKNKRLVYDPRIEGRFKTVAEIRRAIEMYETGMIAGDVETIDVTDVRKDLLKYPSKDKPKYIAYNRNIIPSEDNLKDYGIKHPPMAVIFPQPINDANKKIKEALKGANHEVAEILKCNNCKKDIELGENDLLPLCPDCKESYFSKMEEDDKRLNTYTSNADRFPILDSANEGNEKIRITTEAMASSILLMLKNPNVTQSFVIGKTFKFLRESIPEKKVKEIYDKMFKGKREYPIPDGLGRIIIPQSSLAKYFEEQGLELETNVKNIAKWISKIESGHATIFTEPKEIRNIGYYEAMFWSIYGDDDPHTWTELAQWTDILIELSEKKLDEIIKEPERPKPKPVIHKVMLDLGKSGYHYIKSPSMGGPTFKWEKISDPIKIIEEEVTSPNLEIVNTE